VRAGFLLLGVEHPQLLNGAVAAGRGVRATGDYRFAMRRTRMHYGAHRSQVGDLWMPAAGGDVPLVVLIHGGFWRAQYTKALMGRLARAVVEQGWAAWNIEYRRVGTLGGGGGWPTTFADVAAAVDAVATMPGIDAGRVVTCGHSAGGTLALWAAARGRGLVGLPGAPAAVALRAAVALAGVSDLESADELGLGRDAVAGVLGGGRAQVPDRFLAASPVALLPLGIPEVLIHGLADSVVPASMSARFVDRATRAGDDARYIALPGVGHRDLIDARGEAWTRLSAQLVDVLA
jgi:dipeptidyl aminopeptidase/acylaminoacyl peptidase